MKYCTSCKTTHPLSEFYMRKDGTVRTPCKACSRAAAMEWQQAHPENRKRHQRTTFGKRQRKLTDRRNTLLLQQGGVCAICGTDEPGTSNGWHLDHDHSCCPRKGGVGACGNCDRGVLCNSCNTRIVPTLENTPAEVMFTALNYLGIAS